MGLSHEIWDGLYVACTDSSGPPDVSLKGYTSICFAAIFKIEKPDSESAWLKHIT